MRSIQSSQDHRPLRIRRDRLFLGLATTALGAAGLIIGLILDLEPFPFEHALAVGMPGGLLLGSGGLAVLLTGGWLMFGAFYRDDRPGH